MTRSIVAVLALALAATACGDKQDADPAGGEAKQPAPEGEGAVPAAPPYDGPLTVDRMEQAKAKVRPFMPWDQAKSALWSSVGEPAIVEDGKYYWYLLEGDKCHELYVEDAGGEVGAVSFGAYDKLMAKQWERCQRAVGPGEAAEPAEAAPAGDAG